ncbi:Protein RER1 [Apostichopus japonicus]|uniref:Protein RER1 n=1 Tax=Stichopus japonicus TaxID=307972 RepID=A0A2G8L498_STIJA|nr:Protein RER1 [Apostichopus japonicus]
MEPDPSDVVSSQPGFLSRFFTGMSQRYQTYLDRSVPHSPARWVATLLLEFCYLGRVFFLQGWYIVTYALGIYQLNLFIAFLTPKMEPVITEDSEDDGPTLPTKANEEFRPFIRRLPEFKFWYSATKSIVIASFCTFFDIFNVPVFWPILVMYFFILFFLTMRRQIEHMVKYRYSHGQEAKQNTRAKKIQEMLYNEETQLVWRNLVSFSFMSVDYLHIPSFVFFSLQPFSKLKDFTNGVLL